ncbi:MAG: TetR/AcrR family transcriptional regulator [Beijerinckiaceae bacterium]
MKRDILNVALTEFAEKGLAGARVDEIAAKTSTSKRMIYYYFSDKEGLYRAALEEAYLKIRLHERGLDLETLAPPEAIAELTRATFNHHARNQDFVRLVMVENIHQARHLASSEKIGALNLPALDMLRSLYQRGVGSGEFRSGLEAIDIHLMINSMSFYNVSNRYTVRQIFGYDMGDAQTETRRRESIVDAVLRYLKA